MVRCWNTRRGNPVEDGLPSVGVPEGMGTSRPFLLLLPVISSLREVIGGSWESLRSVGRWRFPGFCEFGEGCRCPRSPDPRFPCLGMGVRRPFAGLTQISWDPLLAAGI